MLYRCKLKVARNGLWSLRPTDVEQTISTLGHFLKTTNLAGKRPTINTPQSLYSASHLFSTACVSSCPQFFIKATHQYTPHAFNNVPHGKPYQDLSALLGTQHQMPPVTAAAMHQKFNFVKALLLPILLSM